MSYCFVPWETPEYNWCFQTSVTNLLWHIFELYNVFVSPSTARTGGPPGGAAGRHIEAGAGASSTAAGSVHSDWTDVHRGTGEWPIGQLILTTTCVAICAIFSEVAAWFRSHNILWWIPFLNYTYLKLYCSSQSQDKGQNLSFLCHPPILWNTPHDNIQSAKNVITFRRHLNTYLFNLLALQSGIDGHPKSPQVGHSQPANTAQDLNSVYMVASSD